MQSASGPWHEGVSPADQEAALALFDQAVALQRQWLLAEAAAHYEQALARWEHPKIRFYLGRAQEKMGDLVSSHENLRLALRWGLDAFTGGLDIELTPLVTQDSAGLSLGGRF